MCIANLLCAHVRNNPHSRLENIQKRQKNDDGSKGERSEGVEEIIKEVEEMREKGIGTRTQSDTILTEIKI